MIGKIRTHKFSDLAIVSSFLKEELNQEWNVSSLERSLTNPMSFLLIYEEEGHVAGFILFNYIIDELEILQCGVLPCFRGRYIGFHLFKYLFETLAPAKAFLDVSERNYAAKALYQKLGFDEVFKRPDYYKVPEGRVDAIVMEKIF